MTLGRPQSPAHPALGQLAAVESFALDGVDGVIVSRYRPTDLSAEVARLLDPSAAVRTLHWGRSYLYLADLQTAHGPVPVVVKQFRNDGWRARWRQFRRGPAAERSWTMARALTAAGIGTPEPVLVAESHRPDGPSFFVTRYLPAVHEARGLFRAINAGDLERRYGWSTNAAVLESAAAAIRRLHDAGFWHRDVSAGNLLFQPPLAAHGAPDVLFVDLNRARTMRPGLVRRSRDLCRLWIARPSDRLDFINAYWRGRERALWLKIGAYSVMYHVFRLREVVKPRVKDVLRWRDWIIATRPHPHIPAAPGSSSLRDKTVWDPLSDQPYQKAGRWEKLGVRLVDGPEHAREYLTAIAAVPRIWRQYRALQAAMFSAPSRVTGAGVSTVALPGRGEQILEALTALPTRRVLLRLYPWDAPHGTAHELARELSARGFDLAFSIPQTRAFVNDPARWAAALDEIAERFTPIGRQFQIGQAINRSKWGIWTLREYDALYAAAAERLRQRRPDVELLGPPIIDFEFHHLAAAVNLHHAGVHFDIVSSQLYVDRRGAPENRQLGFDTTDKVVLLRAIADTARYASARTWITEMNWSLWEGPYSPAGRRTSVDETTQADYLVRYFILALTTGLVERVYWWQLAARGYGLCDPTDRGLLRRRASFDAFATFVRQLEGAWSVGPLATPWAARLYRFRRGDEDVVVGWSTQGRLANVALPGRVLRVIDRDGVPGPIPHDRQVDLGPSPQYFVLEPDRPPA
jgi:hypothetical protein